MNFGFNKHTLKRKVKYLLFLLGEKHKNKEQFNCPICNYTGPFINLERTTGARRHAECPKCGALERHRIQALVMRNLIESIDTKNMKMLHFAPEPFFRKYFSKHFTNYETADLEMENVDHNVDLQNLPFNNESYDFIYASHVLEHVPNDRKAISEIRRVLKPGGIAVLPVPFVAEKTIEYPEANPNEAYHMRAPGYDYIDRYKQVFSKVVSYSSNDLNPTHQLYIYEDRSQWPTPECPLRPPMPGEKHIDIVPICYV